MIFFLKKDKKVNLLSKGLKNFIKHNVNLRGNSFRLHEWVHISLVYAYFANFYIEKHSDGMIDENFELEKTLITTFEKELDYFDNKFNGKTNLVILKNWFIYNLDVIEKLPHDLPRFWKYIEKCLSFQMDHFDKNDLEIFKIVIPILQRKNVLNDKFNFMKYL